MIICRAGIAQGSGFGNIFLSTAKALVCSCDLGLPFMRGHYRPPYKSLPHAINNDNMLRYSFTYLMTKASHRNITFDDNAYKSTGCKKISEALSAYLSTKGIPLESNYAVTFPGLNPGIESVVHRSEYIRSVLFQDKEIARAVYQNLDQLNPRKLRIGIHIRQGDFAGALPLGTQWPKGEWNIRIPLDWYSHICKLLVEDFPNKLDLVVFSNSNSDDADVAKFCSDFNCKRFYAKATRSAADVVDLLTLSLCDLQVLSVSWFSYWAMAFSGNASVHYTWAPNPLINDIGRGFMLGIENQLPDQLTSYIESALSIR